jgi:hypothetical protein
LVNSILNYHKILNNNKPHVLKLCLNFHTTHERKNIHNEYVLREKHSVEEKDRPIHTENNKNSPAHSEAIGCSTDHRPLGKPKGAQDAARRGLGSEKENDIMSLIMLSFHSQSLICEPHDFFLRVLFVIGDRNNMEYYIEGHSNIFLKKCRNLIHLIPKTQGKKIKFIDSN